MTPYEPAADCALCGRLVEFRLDNAAANPAWHNRPVPSFGGIDARLLIVGLAPGLRGANATGRPFPGDAAGAPPYSPLAAPGFALAVAAGSAASTTAPALPAGHLPDVVAGNGGFVIRGIAPDD